MDALETGRRIQTLRKQRNWTQKDLAQRLNVTDKSVSKWERGLNFPDMVMLEPLATALDTTVVELLGIENAPEVEKLEAVTNLAVEETARMRKETKERALVILFTGIIWLGSQFVLGQILYSNGIHDTLPRMLTFGMSGFAGNQIGNALWIWWKYRK